MSADDERDDAQEDETKPRGAQRPRERRDERAASGETEQAADATTGESTDTIGKPGEETRGTPAFFEYWNQMDFVTWMGARIIESADGHATVYFEPGKHHRGAGVGGRAVTGAVQAYIFDIVTGAAVASLAHGTRPQVTVTLDVTFEHPAYDAPLTFEARVLSGGRQIFFVDAVCTDPTGQVCSRARALYRRFERRISADEAKQHLKSHGTLASSE